jgi:hypothetical protein
MKFSAPHKKNTRWKVDLEFILTFYDCYVRQQSLRVAAAALNMRLTQLTLLIRNNTELQLAQEMADQNRPKSTLKHYILTSLSKETRVIWDRLTKTKTLEEIDAVFHKRPIKMRQQLFCHAILHTGYDISRACAMVGVDRMQMEKWKGDLEFLQMLEEVQFHKKNFFEHALIGLVTEGYPGAVIFANRTINRDRGYSEKVTIESNLAGVQVDWDIADLDLDVATMKKVLDAIERKKARAQQEDLAVAVTNSEIM